MGLGTKKRQAEPLSEEEKELLWEKGLLGEHCAPTLVDTVFYSMCGTYFALRSGHERHDPSQIQLVERPGQRTHVKYSKEV